MIVVRRPPTAYLTVSAPTRLELPESAHPPCIPAWVGATAFRLLSRSPRNERHFMMNHNDGWMGGWGNGWSGGGMLILAVIGILVAVLLVVAMVKLSKK